MIKWTDAKYKLPEFIKVHDRYFVTPGCIVWTTDNRPTIAWAADNTETVAWYNCLELDITKDVTHWALLSEVEGPNEH